FVHVNLAVKFSWDIILLSIYVSFFIKKIRTYTYVSVHECTDIYEYQSN
ncbi:unnamed protein product, partial [Rotaria magnacalcarata]